MGKGADNDNMNVKCFPCAYCDKDVGYSKVRYLKKGYAV